MKVFENVIKNEFRYNEVERGGYIWKRGKIILRQCKTLLSM